MPIVAVCVYCSHKIDEKEKTVNAPDAAGEIAHLTCAQKITIVRPEDKDPYRSSKVTPGAF